DLITEALLKDDISLASRMFSSAMKGKPAIAVWERSDLVRRSGKRDYADRLSDLQALMSSHSLIRTEKGTWYESQGLRFYRGLWQKNHQIAQGIKVHIDATDDTGKIDIELLSGAVSLLEKWGFPFKISEPFGQKLVRTHEDSSSYDQEGKTVVIWLVDIEGAPLKDWNKIEDFLSSLESYLSKSPKTKTHFSHDGTTNDQLYGDSGRLGYRFGSYNSGVVIVPSEKGLEQIRPDDHHKHDSELIRHTGLYGSVPEEPFEVQAAKKMSLTPVKKETNVVAFLNRIIRLAGQKTTITDNTNFRTAIRGRSDQIFGIKLESDSKKDDIPLHGNWLAGMNFSRLETYDPESPSDWVIKFGQFADGTSAIASWLKEWKINSLGMKELCAHDPVSFLSSIGHEDQAKKLEKAWLEGDHGTVNNIINTFFCVKDKGLFTAAPMVKGGFTLNKILHVLYPEIHAGPDVKTPEEAERFQAECAEIKRQLDALFARKTPDQRKEILSSWAQRIHSIAGKLHRNGIVHRDLKPDNILINIEKQDIRIIDFETAIFTEKRGENIIIPEVKKAATPGYAHFYQFNEDIYTALRSVGEKALWAYLKAQDVFALEVISDELVNGDTPFDAAEWETFSSKGMAHRMIKNGHDLILARNMVDLARAHQTGNYEKLLAQKRKEYQSFSTGPLLGAYEEASRLKYDLQILRKKVELSNSLKNQAEEKEYSSWDALETLREELSAVSAREKFLSEKISQLEIRKRSGSDLSSLRAEFSEIRHKRSVIASRAQAAEEKYFASKEEADAARKNSQAARLEYDVLAGKYASSQSLLSQLERRKNNLERFLSLVEWLSEEKPEMTSPLLPDGNISLLGGEISWVGGDNFTGGTPMVTSQDLDPVFIGAEKTLSLLSKRDDGLPELPIGISSEGKVFQTLDFVDLGEKRVNIRPLNGSVLASISEDGKTAAVNWNLINVLLALAETPDSPEKITGMKKILSDALLPADIGEKIYSDFSKVSSLSSAEKYMIAGRVLLHEITEAYLLQSQLEDAQGAAENPVDRSRAHFSAMVAELYAGNTLKIRSVLGPILASRDLNEARGVISSRVSSGKKDFPAASRDDFKETAEKISGKCYQDLFFGKNSYIFVLGAEPSVSEGTLQEAMSLGPSVSSSAGAARSFAAKQNFGKVSISHHTGKDQALSALVSMASLPAGKNRVHCSISRTLLSEMDADPSVLAAINASSGAKTYSSVSGFLSSSAITDIIDDRIEPHGGDTAKVLPMPYNEASLHGIARLNLSHLLSEFRDENLDAANPDFMRAVNMVALTVALMSGRNDVDSIAFSLLSLAGNNPREFFVSGNLSIFLPPAVPRNHEEIREDYLSKAALLRYL
ncbi:MAG TPA: phosphotransferase, partial [Candidatus Omnitrophota bacterium]|nr:phosphotransferase [Candidatus Omnitrophota bacterium]